MNFKNYDATVLASNPAMYHKMNMAAGATSIDETSNNHNALQSNTSNILSQVAGVVPDLDDSAAEFRVNGYMNVNSVAAPTWPSDWTIETWFYYPFPNDRSNCNNYNRWCTLVRTRNITNQGRLVCIIVTMICCSGREPQVLFYLVDILSRTYLKAGITLCHK